MLILLLVLLLLLLEKETKPIQRMTILFVLKILSLALL